MHRSVTRVMVALAATLALAFAGGGAAQDAAVPPHPSHIHAGTCAELDPNPAYPLNDVAPLAADAAVDTATSTIDVSLDDLLASPSAINVHASADDIETYIACGDIAGPVVDGTLLVPLREQSDSGYSGVAVLTSTGAGTEVTVYLTPDQAAAIPEAATSAVEVAIIDFGFDADRVEVPVGTTVTWTNAGQIIHTATSKDGLWDSNILNPGDTFSYTFTEPGTYDYWCTLHPAMLGTIVVTGS